MSTLLQLRDRCKEESDNVNQSFLTDAEWTKRINNAYREAYGLLAEKFGDDYFVKATPQSITTDGTNQQFALASDFFKSLLVEVLIQGGAGTQYVTLKRMASLADKNTLSMFNTQIPASGQTVRVWYIPRVTALAADADTTVDAFDVNGWDELIVVDACIVAVAKEESDVSVLMARKAALTARIEHEAANRDAGSPSRIVDVQSKRARSMQYKILGSNILLVGGSTPGWYYGAGDWGPGDYDDFWGG
jgi:hypothetical protein